MSKVYSNSFCNISAAAAPDGNSSMFNDRLPDAIFPEIVNFSPVDKASSQYLVLDDDFWDTEVSRANVNTRAWVLQERLLSTRILSFGQSQLCWECNEKQAAEIYPLGLPGQGNAQIKLKSLFNQTMQHPHPEVRDGDPSRALAMWANILDAYTSCNLSFPSDRLVAISSIAEKMKPLIDGEYIVGMWHYCLEAQLVWCSLDDSLPRPKYRAPSVS